MCCIHALRVWVTLVLLGSFVLTGAGCTVMRPIRPSANPSRPVYSHVKRGDFVVLNLRDAGRIEVIVKAVETDAIVATDGTRYLYTDIQRLQVRMLTKGQSAVVGAVGAAAVFVILLLTSSGPLLPPGAPGPLRP